VEGFSIDLNQSNAIGGVVNSTPNIWECSLMSESNPATRIICNNLELADQLRQLLAPIAPDCEVLSTPGNCSAVPLCRWLGEAKLGSAGQVQAALLDATEVLEQTRHAFKSRELGLLRRRLVALLDKLSEDPQ